MKRAIQILSLAALAMLAVPSPASAGLSTNNGHCIAATTSCTLSATATGSIQIFFAFRNGSTTPPSLPGSTTSIATGTGTSTSWRLYCKIASSGSDTGSGTATNASDISGISYAGGDAITTATCASGGAGGRGAASWTNSTNNCATLTMTIGNGSGVVACFTASAATTCMPTGMTQIDTVGTGPSLKSGDSNGNVSSWAGATCTSTNGNGVSVAVELFGSCNNTVYGTWTCIQHRITQCGGSVSNCAITVTTTGSGHAAIVTSPIGSGTLTISSISDGTSTYSLPGCGGTDGTAGSIDSGYTTALASGKTSITVNYSGTASGPVVHFVEVGNSGTIAYDTCANRDQSSNSTTPAGVTLTLGGTDDFIVQGITSAGTASAITNTWAALFSAGNGGAERVTTSGAAPTWTNTNTRSELIATALKATAASSAIRHRVTHR